MHDPLVSVIVCTRDRPQQLLRCLGSIASAADAHAETAVEIIILENLSQPHLALDEGEVLRLARGRGRFVKLMEAGLSRARNVGIRLARGRLLVFTDDDCIMDVAFFTDLAQHAVQYDGDLFIGGRVKLADPDDLPFTVKDVAESQEYNVSIHPGGFILGCNFVVSRHVVDNIGPFDTRFGAGAPFRAGEDTDYIIRAHLAGVRMRYVPDMCVLHQHGRKRLAEIEELNRSYAFGNGALYAKYFRQLWLLKHLYWSVRLAIIERFGGRGFNKEIGLTWHSTVRNNFAGLCAYFVRPGMARHRSQSSDVSAVSQPAKRPSDV